MDCVNDNSEFSFDSVDDDLSFTLGARNTEITRAAKFGRFVFWHTGLEECIESVHC